MVNEVVHEIRLDPSEITEPPSCKSKRKRRLMAASRSNTPALSIRSPHPNPHPKSTLTIEEWEAKAPLGDAESKSIAAIKTASERRPDLQPSTVVCSFHYEALR